MPVGLAYNKDTSFSRLKFFTAWILKEDVSAGNSNVTFGPKFRKIPLCSALEMVPVCELAFLGTFA